MEFNVIYKEYPKEVLTHIHNEIYFDKIGKQIISVKLSVPGIKRDIYNWKGSEEEFNMIRGIYDVGRV